MRSRAAIVRGEVRDPAGKPVAGARVVVTGAPVPMPEIAAVTDANGRFSIAAPSAGEYTFSAHAAHLPGPAVGSIIVPASAPSKKQSLLDSMIDDPNADVSSEGGRRPTASDVPDVHIVLAFGNGDTAE